MSRRSSGSSNYLVAGGVHGLFILGSCGEGPSLSHRVRRQLIDRTCAHVDGRIPVLVGITDTVLCRVAALAEHAADAGADAVVLSAPYYFPIDQADLVAYVQRLAREVPLPVTLYNMPALTRMSFELGDGPPVDGRAVDRRHERQLGRFGLFSDDCAS